MRISSLLALALAATALLTASPATHADYDFSALLADVDFKDEAKPAPVKPQDGFNLPPATQVPANQPLAFPELPVTKMDEAADQAEAVVPQPITDPENLAEGHVAEEHAAAEHAAPCNSCGQCNAGCGHHHIGLRERIDAQIHGRIQHVGCQTYSVPRLPVNTFYQNWRSNACNVHVWDGFHNQCPHKIDMSIRHLGPCHCGKCRSGCGTCGNGCGQCASTPCDEPACDAPGCDAQPAN